MLPSKPSKEDNYQYLLSIMEEADITTTEKVDEHTKALVKKAKHYSVIPLVILFGGYWLVPQIMFFWILFAVSGFAWIWASTYSTTTMMKRYRQSLESTKE